jgi:hypothetical protein
MAALPANTPAPLFHVPHQAGWHPFDITVQTGYPAVYDTWSWHYEDDRIDQDQFLAGAPTWRTQTLDQGIGGLDDDDANGPDDVGERETSPPYNTPLRGVKVVLRIYETDARQIRETSVTHSFAE